jgi:hypothetical protein
LAPTTPTCAATSPSPAAAHPGQPRTDQSQARGHPRGTAATLIPRLATPRPTTSTHHYYRVRQQAHDQELERVQPR